MSKSTKTADVETETTTTPTREECLTLLTRAPYLRGVTEDGYAVWWHEMRALLDRVDPDELEALWSREPLDRAPRPMMFAPRGRS